MAAPSNNLLRLARRLFSGAEEQSAFLAALESPRPYQPAVMWMQERPAERPFALAAERPAWLPEFVDLAAAGERPGQHPLHEAGAYYCLDASSVFAASVLTAVEAKPEAVLDVCASPGGKSLFAWLALQPHFLMANEAIGKRTAQLIANLKRCGAHPAAVSNADPGVLSHVCPSSADVVIVDAPCSGQSLIARGQEAPGCFHPATINLNANRQRRILAHAAECTAPGGWLAYITCTYAEKENEGNAAWFLRQFSDFTAVPVPVLAGHESHLADIPCYRLWPQGGAGAGAFAVLLRRAGDESPATMAGLRTVWSSAA